MGRPLKFKSEAELALKIQEYFTECQDQNRPLTIEMLAWKLGTTRRTLLGYEEKEEYFHTIKNAKQYIYATKIEKLNTEKSNTTGIIFDLCNNGDGYSNKHNEQDKSTTIIINDKTKEIA